MKAGLWDYVRVAFNAKPLGMFIPPNWLGLGLFAMLGAMNPGFWLVGLGLEFAYLGALASNARFQRWVRALHQWESRRQWQVRIDSLVDQLSADGQRRYRSLEVRCRAILEQQFRSREVPAGLEEQGEGLGRLLWVYLRLLLMRQAVERILHETAQTGSEDLTRLQERMENLETRLKSDDLGDDLRKSLAGQVDILRQRLEKRREARDKLAFLDAELMRIQEQAELVREQAVLSTDPEMVSQRIDQITSTLGTTTQWIGEQQNLYGAVEDLMAEPPALSIRVPPKVSQ